MEAQQETKVLWFIAVEGELVDLRGPRKVCKLLDRSEHAKCEHILHIPT